MGINKFRNSINGNSLQPKCLFAKIKANKPSDKKNRTFISILKTKDGKMTRSFCDELEDGAIFKKLNILRVAESYNMS